MLICLCFGSVFTATLLLLRTVQTIQIKDLIKNCVDSGTDYNPKQLSLQS